MASSSSPPKHTDAAQPVGTEELIIDDDKSGGEPTEEIDSILLNEKTDGTLSLPLVASEKKEESQDQHAEQPSQVLPGYRNLKALRSEAEQKLKGVDRKALAGPLKKMFVFKTMLDSMTPQELESAEPTEFLCDSRKKRILYGSGRTPQDMEDLLEYFKTAKPSG